MKARIYFIVAAVISVLLSIYSIVKSKEIVKSNIDAMKEAYTGFPQDFQNRIIGMYEKSGVKLVILFSIIVIICNAILLVLVKNKSLIRNKGLVIILSILIVFFSNMLLAQLLAVANFIIIFCCKRKNPEDFKLKEKKEIPKLTLEKIEKKDILLSFLLLVIYFSQFIWGDYLPENFYTKLVIEISFNIIMIFLSILVFHKQLKNNFLAFKNNFSAYVKIILSNIGVAYLFLFVASMISTLTTKNAVSVNQENLESLPIYYLIPAAVIYAPIVEEIIFRGILRRFIKNTKIFVLISALLFGLLHTMDEGSFSNILLMSLPYITLGFFISRIYAKTNNLFTNITTHMIFNSISCIFMIFI